LITKIKNMANTEDKKRLLSNFFSLSVLQGANYILPLITLPYLVRVLGVEYFGLLAFAGATIAYFGIITDYGFNLTATREISIHRDNREKVIEIFSSVMTIKVILMFVSFFLLSLLVFSFEKFSKDALVYFLTFGTVVGQVLFPVWFFQGMERMKYITYLNILSKVIFTIAIFVFVQEQSDFYLVPLLTSIGFLVAGIWSLYLVKKEFGVMFKLQTIDTIKYHLGDGWYIFLSQLKISLFSSTNIIILGLLTNNSAVGYYSAAEKIMRAVAMLMGPLAGALFPNSAKNLNNNFSETVKKLYKVLKVAVIIQLIIIIPIFIFSEKITFIIFNDSNAAISDVLKIIIIAPVFMLINNFFGIQIMLNAKKEKEYFLILLIGGFLNLILCSSLTYYYSYIGTAISLLLIEFLIMFLMIVSVKNMEVKI
jgi:PST family polysaccharide transporter